MSYRTFPPSPTPPWSRPPINPITHTLTDEGEISLGTLTTYLNQTAPIDSEDETIPYVVTLADGSYLQQRKVIQIPGSAIENTARWRVTGTFAGFVSLLLDRLGHSAELIWDGSAWHLSGGNATREDA